ncbi:MAG TPA: Gfo/Idh/MocA family oxidoreductase [Terriglobales bacterium]|nr:Gfo/Idh/MocA family oxidoreductase [Terriglobales bacterium]
MNKKTLNVGMIGTGFIAKAHSNAFRQTGFFFQIPYDIRLKVICGRDRAKAEANAAQWGWGEVETDWRKVVERKDIDAIDIATPNALHAPIAIAAAQAGKIVLCEKPLAVSLPEAGSMAKAVSQVPNMVWFNYRRVPAVAFARQLLDEGHLGQVFHYRALYLNQSGNDPAKASGWRYQKSEAGSGVMGDLLSHSVDEALYLNGPIAELTAMTQTFFPGRDVDDADLFLARFANGSIGTFEATRFGIGCRNRNSFEINGAKGMLAFNLEEMNRLEFTDATEVANLRDSKKLMVTGPNQPYADVFWKPGHIIGYEHTFIATLGDFLGGLANARPFHPNFEDAVAVQRVLDAVERSAASKSWVKCA